MVDEYNGSVVYRTNTPSSVITENASADACISREWLG
jgi:hypothetical protein